MRSAKDLMPHQRAAIERNVAARRQANLLKMGLGKTAIALFSLTGMREVRRTLVTAPAMVVERDVWGREAREWRELRRLRVQPLVGTAKRRGYLLEQPADVDVVSYENLKWLQAEVGRFEDRYDAVVFDELSKLKHAGSQRFKKLRHFSMDVPVRLGLTGSPVGNHLLDLWGEMFMVAGAAPLGGSFVKFKQEWFIPSNPMDPTRCSWTPRHGAEEHITRAIQPHAFSISERAAAGVLPEVKLNPVDLALPLKVRDLADRLWKECRAEMPSGVDLVALNASAKAMKLRQLVSGAAYYDPLDESKWEDLHDVKLRALEEALDEQQGEPLICFYWFKHELARIRERFPHAREASHDVLDAWDRREVPLLLLHPGSTAHGLNLQRGGSSVFWFTLPYSHEMFEQGNGRVARPGQRAPHVVASAALCGDMDRAVWDLLTEKGSTQSRVMEGVELVSREDLLADPAFG